MSEFPRLQTGAVTQYPARKQTRYSTSVLEFVDGSEQRFAEMGGVLRRWIVDLAQLEEEELYRLEDHFITEQGDYGSFSFTDPWDGAEYGECSLENPEVLFEFLDFNRATTHLIVRENRI
jgi:phage-related protein